MGYKHETIKSDVASAVSEAYGEVQNLRDEVRDIVDNASGTNLENTSRNQTLSETADTLDNYADDEPEVPECISSRDVSYTVHTAKRGVGRGTRMSNAISAINAVIDEANQYISELDGLDPWGDGHPNYTDYVAACGDDKPESFEEWAKGREKPEGALTEKEIDQRKAEVEEFVSELENHKSEFESVEFPGMFG